ncbi:hypothetical protein N7517_001110 [Penicillium concentricum]|uniref:Uncharacterized protein n=1 Tax=Penicillium concentricum TaxID=293559 RepID=A0A9W9VJK2_9EURO|nr:uncharacterized protein N7517_001110 [Penicillium concentricum]KAJ5383199.1 hypothetical protein N7517_001110 [Penicillium concentricum]
MIRQRLIELSSRWKELVLDGSCSYSPNEEELRKHKQDLEDFEVQQTLMFWLMANMNTNSAGWVPNGIGRVRRMLTVLHILCGLKLLACRKLRGN